MPQTLSEIRTALAAAGLRPQKMLGQNFLIDGNLMHKLVEAAGIETSDVVLEVGGGTGSLTEMLVTRAGQVVTVEVDHKLFALLEQRCGALSNLTLLQGDVLQSKSRVSEDVLAALQQAIDHLAETVTAPRVMLVANLPYHVASPLLVDLLLCKVPFARFCFCVQREVAERIVAGPNSKEYGPISIALQSCSTIKRIARIPPQAFWPAPKVASVVLRADIDLGRFQRPGSLPAFISLVRLGFAHRRKILNYNLRQRYEDAVLHQACGQAGVDLHHRPEALSLEQWWRLFQTLPPPADDAPARS